MPLRECDFSPKIQRCYFSAKEFYSELNMEETLEIFKVFDDCPLVGEAADAGPSQPTGTVHSPGGCGLLGNPVMSPLSVRDNGSSHSTTMSEALKGMKTDRSGTLANGDLEDCMLHESEPLTAVPYSMNRATNSGLEIEKLVLGNRERNLCSPNLEKTSVFVVQQQTEGEQKNLPISLGPRVENKHFQENAGFGANCLPVFFGNQFANEGNAIDSPPVDSGVDDRMSNASFGQIQHPLGVHLMPPSCSPGASNENNETLDDASNLRQEIQRCTVEILRLKEECRKVRTGEILGKHCADKLQSPMEEKEASTKKLMDELLQSKMENKQLREQNDELASALKGVKAELAEAQERSRTARKVQETLLKIQNETMDEMDRRRTDSLELRVKYQEVLATNKFLEAKLDRLLAAEQDFPRPRVSNNLQDVCREGSDLRESTNTQLLTNSLQYSTNNENDFSYSAIGKPGDRKLQNCGQASNNNHQVTNAPAPNSFAIAPRPQIDKSLVRDGASAPEDTFHEQPMVGGYPPGLSLSSATCIDKFKGVDTQELFGQESSSHESLLHPVLDKNIKQPFVSTGMGFQKTDEHLSSVAQSSNQNGRLSDAQHAGSVGNVSQGLRTDLAKDARVDEGLILPRARVSAEVQHNTPGLRMSSMRTRDDNEGASSQQENKKKQKRDFSSFSLPVPIVELNSRKVNALTQKEPPGSSVPFSLPKSSEVSSTLAIATTVEAQVMQLPIPALMQKPIPTPPVATIAGAAKSCTEPSKEDNRESSAIASDTQQATSSDLCSLPLPCNPPKALEETEIPACTDSCMPKSSSAELLRIPELESPLPEKYVDLERSSNISSEISVPVCLPVPHVIVEQNRNSSPQACGNKQGKEHHKAPDVEPGLQVKGDTQDLNTSVQPGSQVECDTQDLNTSVQPGSQVECDTQDLNTSDVRNEMGISDLISESGTSFEKPTYLDTHHNVPSEENSLLVFGGKTEKEVDLRMGQVYNVSTGEWKPIAGCTLPSELEISSLASVCYAGTVYIVGGMTSTGRPEGTFYSFSLSTGTWKELPKIPTSRAACGLVEIDRKLYVMGGRNSDRSLATVEIFDPDAGKWLKGPAMKSQRAYHSCVTCGGCIFSIGGMLTRELLSSVERLDPRVGTWETVARVSSPRTALACASNSIHIVAAGGVTCTNKGNDFSVLNSVEVYEPRRNIWYDGIPMIEPRAWCSLTYLHNRLYAIGGKKTIHTDHHAGIEVFDIQKPSSWTILTETNKRAFHSSCSLYPDKLST